MALAQGASVEGQLLLSLLCDIKVVGLRQHWKQVLVLRWIELGMSHFRGYGEVVLTLAVMAGTKVIFIMLVFWM